MKSRMNAPLHCLMLATLALTGCTDLEEQTAGQDTDRTPTVALQVSSVTAGTEARTLITDTRHPDKIAVYAQSKSTNTATNHNNHAIYTYVDNGATGNGNWTMSTSPQILLSDEVADIYACYPSTITLNDAATDINASTTIPLSVFKGETEKNADNTLPLPQSGETSGSFHSAPGETDYLWAEPVRASNGKGTDAQGTTYAIALTMNHALSQVSFRIYKDNSYTNEGLLTKIQIAGIPTGTNPKMTIADGAIDTGSRQTGTYTRYVGESGYKLSSFSKTPDNNALQALPSFGMLVLPDAATDKSAISAVFTVDGKTYSVNFSDTDKVWKAGENCRYTIHLSGTQAELSSIHVQSWEDTAGENNNDIY